MSCSDHEFLHNVSIGDILNVRSLEGPIEYKGKHKVSIQRTRKILDEYSICIGDILNPRVVAGPIKYKGKHKVSTIPKLLKKSASMTAEKGTNVLTIPKLVVWPITSGFNSAHEEDLVQVLYLWWRICTHFNSGLGSPTCWKRLGEYFISIVYDILQMSVVAVKKIAG
ncbi:hypothetical protein BDQ17DRAFT_1328315 [Cyathus striatus]|nr:hypothetical protein BDQ17DRAFT_1328315 [Cyathus striatus]